MDTKDVWDTCPWILEGLGMTRKQARGMIGKWLKYYGPERTSRAILAAERLGTLDPLPYIEATLAKTQSARRENGHWIIRSDSAEAEAWIGYYKRCNDERSLASFRYLEEVKVRSRWPTKPG